MTSERSRPWLAVTMGDAAGIGPEVIVRAWSDPRVHRVCQAVVLGHPEILRRAVALVESVDTDGRPPEGQSIDVVDVRSPREVASSIERMPCLPVGADDILEVAPGTVDARTGEAAYAAILKGIDLALGGDVDGITTAPISKLALTQAGYRYPGHTELLAERCGVDDFAMMLYLPHERQSPGPVGSGLGGLGVVHVTLHTALRNVFPQLTPEAILTACRLADREVGWLIGRRPRLAVCALNPHGGENGLFGDEEITIIRPAVERGRREGMEVTGPLPTDTLFTAARDGDFDAVVAMYHDQGHIALKLLGMHRAVNVTLGLPIVRTSVAHGTAWDRAWQGRAIGSGMVAALQVAAELAITRGR
jgi:4-hydroxythreonine-4-phosphate dehydrogenase